MFQCFLGLDPLLDIRHWRFLWLSCSWVKELLFGSIFFGDWRERLLNLEYVHNTLADSGHEGTITAGVTRTSYNDNDKQGDRVSER